jgi:hypothetical protein
MYALVKENKTHFRMINSFQLRTRKAANELKHTYSNSLELKIIKLDKNPYPLGAITISNLKAPIKNFIQEYKPKPSKMNVKIEVISGSSKVKVKRTDGSESILCRDLQHAVNHCNEQDLTVVNKDQIATWFSKQLKK